MQIAKIHARIADRRKDWVEKVTTRLVDEYDVIVLEDLKVKNMVKSPKAKPDLENPGQFLPNGAAAKSGLSRSIHATCWTMMQQCLLNKPKQSGVRVLLVNPAFTSQQCHVCSHIAKENRESQAIFRYVRCGHQAHADINAARNILARGTSSRHPQGMGTCASSNAGAGARTSPPVIRRRTNARTPEMQVA